MTPTIAPGPLIAALYFSAGFAGFGVLICLATLWSGIRIRGIGWLTTMCVMAVGYQLATASFHLSPDVAAAFAAKRWQNAWALGQVYAMVGFIAIHMRIHHQRALLTVIGVIVGLMLLVTALRTPEDHFAQHHFQLVLLSFPWGEHLQILQGELSLGPIIGRLIFLSIFLWGFYHALTRHIREDRFGALIIGLGLLLLVVAIAAGGLIETGALTFIYPGGFGYIIFATMALYLVIRQLEISQTQLTNTSAALTREMGEHQQTQRVVEHLSFNDPLTNLPSRAGLFKLVEQTIEAAKQKNGRFAMLHIDIDRFDVINDTLGPSIGDQLLRHASQRIQNLLKGHDFVSRINADEFICIISDPHTAENAGRIAVTIHQALRVPFEIENHVLHVTVSIGIALYPDDADNADTLLTSADLATREAKRMGRDRTEVFHHELNAAIHERMHLGNALRVALDEKQFELYFQPQIDAQSGWIVGLEALIRWRHPEKGLIPPDRFIPLAEEMRLISAIGAWVIDEACRIVAEWRKIGIHGLRVAVNLSAQQLRQNDLVDIVRTALEHHRLTGNDLELEVTESMVMEDPDLCIAQLQRLKALGITLAMDDFGTGYSSLAYLKRLPIDTLKIDRSFVRDLEIDDNDKVICATTISMANSLGLDTVAEGVETGDQARVLRELNCNRFQGYFYARPMPAAAATDFIRQQAAGRAFSSTSA